MSHKMWEMSVDVDICGEFCDTAVTLMAPKGRPMPQILTIRAVS